MAKYKKLHSFYETLIRESFNETIAEKIITNITKYAELTDDLYDMFTNFTDSFSWFSECDTKAQLLDVLTSFEWDDTKEPTYFWQDIHNHIRLWDGAPPEHARINPSMQTRSIQL